MTARDELIRVLRSACSGELAAGYAYRGHWHSVRAPEERERIRIIETEEWHHRELVLGLLRELGAKPSRTREAIFWSVGKVIGILCHVGGWFIPMYGAGRLEKSNIREYEVAAKLAAECGRAAMVDCLLGMAEVEWEHEKYFRERIVGHWMLRVLPRWDAPAEKRAIRAAHAAAA